MLTQDKIFSSNELLSMLDAVNYFQVLSFLFLSYRLTSSKEPEITFSIFLYFTRDMISNVQDLQQDFLDSMNRIYLDKNTSFLLQNHTSLQGIVSSFYFNL